MYLENIRYIKHWSFRIYIYVNIYIYFIELVFLIIYIFQLSITYSLCCKKQIAIFSSFSLYEPN